ncbi:MAG: helix-turn-helix domain-containing protein [Candidatus Pacebacteria bacterium]|nr:helix-turn-helix domain-containing protein [Candidatus Paceibacterota bacterium]
MDPETTTPFEQFFADRIKERGISLKKLADVTGITPSHIESLLRGDFESMPSAPYFRGYLLRLGQELNFDGEEWWRQLKKSGLVKNSGSADTLPRNRFLRQSPPKYLWAIGVAVLLVIYFAFQAPHIFGRPTLTVSFPDSNPYTTASSTLILSGTVTNADALYLNDTQEITVAAGGAWEETVLLGAGPNPFKVTAKKFLGGEASITENILYNPVGGAALPTSTVQPPSSTPTGTASSTPTSTSPVSTGTRQ